MTDKGVRNNKKLLDRSTIPLGLDNRRFESLILSIDGIVWEAKAGNLKFTFVNRNAEQILGYPVEEWLTTRPYWHNLLVHNDR